MMSDTARKYYGRYLENVALASEMEESMSNDRGWSCVVRFYAALHLMTAYLVGKTNVRFNPTSTDHQDRRNAMSQCPELRDAPEKYRNLKDLSQSVRYNVAFEYTNEDRADAIAWLEKIVAMVEPKLKKA
jgi:hypothetical protein